MKKIILALGLLLVLQISAKAQQDAQYTQYMFNSLVINPAYAGYKEALNVGLSARNQWVGFAGTPKTQSFLIDNVFLESKNVGLGLSVVNDKIGDSRQTSAYANYAYRLPVGGEDARLAFGLAIGVVQSSIDPSDIRDQGDVTLMGKRNYFAPDGKLGVFYSNSKFYAGFSTTNLISNLRKYDPAGANFFAKQGTHFFLTAGYLMDLNESLKFKPSLMIREDTKGPTNIDINTFFLLNEAVWLGASYRSGVNIGNKSNLYGGTFRKNSVVGAVEVYVSKIYRIGYSYDYALSQLNQYSNGTHEVSLGLILNSKKKSSSMPTPRYF